MKLPMRLSRGSFDAAVRDSIESDPALSNALLPMLQARQMLFETFSNLIGAYAWQPAKMPSARVLWAYQVLWRVSSIRCIYAI